MSFFIFSLSCHMGHLKWQTEAGTKRYARAVSTIALTVSLFLFSIGGAYAEGSISVSSPELTKGYSLYKDITDKETVSSVQYSDGIINTLKNAGTCSDKAFNIGNGWEVFYFSTCSFPIVSAPTFTANTKLLNLWQAWNEDIRTDITNKAKYAVYSKLFSAMKNTYAYNKGYALYGRDQTKLTSLNVSYSDGSDQAKKNIPVSYLNAQSWSYAVNAMDFLWTDPEIAPSHFFTPSQAERYQRFEKSVLSATDKVMKTTNKSALTKLSNALKKTLTDAKTITKDNDQFAILAITYQVVLERLQNFKG